MSKATVVQFTHARDAIDDALGLVQYAIIGKHTSEQDVYLEAAKQALLMSLTAMDEALQSARKEVQQPTDA
jgi:hypothetical protein